MSDELHHHPIHAKEFLNIHKEDKILAKKKKGKPRKYGSSEGGIKPEQFYNLPTTLQPYTISLNLCNLYSPFLKYKLS